MKIKIIQKTKLGAPFFIFLFFFTFLIILIVSSENWQILKIVGGMKKIGSSVFSIFFIILLVFSENWQKIK